jgi:protein-L-isoaspartate(D-aspartate) O-methyltransferase
MCAIIQIDQSRRRRHMVAGQLASRGIRDPAILDAMSEVPREEFVPRDLVEFAYEDAPLPIDESQTISQPYIVARMIQALELGPGDRVLEVGAGSGYAAAVLSRIAAEVFTIERHKSLADSAGERCRRLGYDNVHVRHGDGSLGWPEEAPFDAIVVAAGGPDVPRPLKEQLAPGGRLVIPVGPLPVSRSWCASDGETTALTRANPWRLSASCPWWEPPVGGPEVRRSPRPGKRIRWDCPRRSCPRRRPRKPGFLLRRR